MGAVAGNLVAVLGLAYAMVLIVGLLTLPSQVQQIQDPWFTLMEFLIIAISPAMVALTVAFHAYVPPERKPMALLGVLFMSMCTVVTCSVHFSVLILSRHPAFAVGEWSRLVFPFVWPSVAYALDILAWDIFFPFAALFAALSMPSGRPFGLVRGLLFAGAGFALLGLAGVPLANMNVRNISIIGYGLFFPMAAALSAGVYRRSAATQCGLTLRSTGRAGT